MARRKRTRVFGGTMPPSQPEEPRIRNPRYIPPVGDNRPIEKLPPEVLAYVFELGTFAEEYEEDWEVEEDDGDENYEDVDDSSEEEGENAEGMEDDTSEMKMPGSYNSNGRQATDEAKAEEEKTLLLPFQVRMSHVCRHWRHIALNTPILWTTLDFTEPQPFAKSQEWLVRSKQCPIDLLIDVTFPDADEDGFPFPEVDLEGYTTSRAAKALEKLTCILDIAISHVTRWRTFELTVGLYQHMHYSLKRLADCPQDPGAPLLQALRLTCEEDDDEPEEDSSREAFREHFLLFGGRTPKLMQLELWGVHVDWKMFIPASERSPVSLDARPSCTTKLTELEFAYQTKNVRPSYEDFVNIIRCSPNLSSLKLTSSGPGPPTQGLPTQPLELPNLLHFSLGFLDEDYARSLMRLLHAPNLKSLTLEFDDGDYTAFIDELIPDMVSTPKTISSRIRKEITNITDLRLGGLPCEDRCAYSIYRACDNLKRLHINMAFLPDSFFSVLIQEDEGDFERTTYHNGLLWRAVPVGVSRRSRHRQPDSYILCRHLESVSISGRTGADYVRFVKKRRNLGAPIKELNVDVNDDVSEADERWLKKNVKAVNFVEFSDDEEIAILDSDDDSEDEEHEWEWTEDDDDVDDEEEHGDDDDDSGQEDYNLTLDEEWTDEGD